MPHISRRRCLQFGTVLVVGLAGCAETQPAPTTDGDGTASPAADASATTAETEQTATSAATTNTTTPSDGLDLREANVVGVAVESQSDGFRFDVTLLHDDSGEDGYANWWQAETLDGERLGRRDLLHAHGTREFTRSQTIEVPDGTTCVVVRGHDQTHGYGGQAMLVNLETGATESVRQGAEKQSFADATCP